MPENIVSELHGKLDIKEPWTQNELDAYTLQDRAFIRNLQLKDKVSKDRAKNKYIRYANKSKGALKKLGRETRKWIKERYPKHVAFKTEREKGFKYPSLKKGEKVKQYQTIKQRKIQVQNIQKIKQQTKGHKTQKRVVRAAIKYPSVSKYELQHGINSAASKRYRARRKEGLINNERV